jgi:phosphoribosylanthranilate isomerase
MSVRVKICGLTTLDDALAAVAAGADALGFILYPRSPRYLTPARAQEIIDRLPPYVERVAVLVNPSREEITAAESEADFSLWQLHGQESAAFCAELEPHRLVKVLALPTPLTREELDAYPVTAFLLDTPSPDHGGTGRTFDWTLISELRQRTNRPLILSGGLNVGNVAEAVKQVHPYAVDVSSGVEIAPGKKDHAKIREFIQLCHS